MLGYLADFLFPRERAQSPVKALSGGERNRLLLARLFAQPANVLVLDEPTNDLDIETLELLEELLDDFDGTVLLVTHDREFLDNVVTSTFAFEGDGRVVEYVGGWQDYLRQVAGRTTVAEPAARARTGGGSRDGAQQARPARRKKTFREEREYAALPARIEDARRRATPPAGRGPAARSSTSRRRTHRRRCSRASMRFTGNWKRRSHDGSNWRRSADDACGSAPGGSRSASGFAERAFQIHLWTGIALGLYVVMLSITGSVLVYRNELDRFLATKRPAFVPGKAALAQGTSCEESAARLYPGWTVTRVGRTHQPTQSRPSRYGSRRTASRRSGCSIRTPAEDLGDSVTQGELGVMWLARLHDELLFDRPGKTWNGVGSIVFTLLGSHGPVRMVAGSRPMASIALASASGSGWKRFNWDLHSAIGLLAVPVHAGLGRIRRSISAFRNRSPTSSTPCPIPRPSTAAAAGDIFFCWLVKLSLRPLAQRAVEGAVGDRGARAGRHVRDRHDHVVAASRDADGTRRRETSTVRSRSLQLQPGLKAPAHDY